ncbi:MAG: hypothetical protein WCF33_15945, partial [Pseudonocardiaceae bacterium]
VLCIPFPTCAFAFVPKAGAQCVSSARWDLCGGPPARAVPTAIICLPCQVMLAELRVDVYLGTPLMTAVDRS